MQRRRVFSLLLPAAIACSGGDPALTEAKPEFAVDCTLLPTLTAPKPITVATQTTRQSVFSLKNNCASTPSGPWDFTASRSGAVVSVGGVSPSFVTLAGGATAKITVTFTTGAASGTGTVTLTATRDGLPITTKSATQTVTVSAPAGGIPFGLFGIKPDTLASGTIWTGGSLSSKNVNNILTQLHASQIKSPHLHMWFSMTGGNEQDFMNADSSFNLQRWKDTLDKYAAPLNADGSSQYAAQLAPYMQDTTFLGIQMLDDLGNFKPDPSFAQIEAMAAHAKLRYPGITTAVRQRPTKLPAGTYTSLEAAWAQYRNNDDGMTAAQYRDAQIAAAKSRHLGLVLGMNIHDGGVPNHPGDIPSDSLLSWGQQLLAAGTSDYGCAFIMWNKDYGNLSDPNMTTIANLAKNHVASPCKFH